MMKEESKTVSSSMDEVDRLGHRSSLGPASPLLPASPGRVQFRGSSGPRKNRAARLDTSSTGKKSRTNTPGRLGPCTNSRCPTRLGVFLIVSGSPPPGGSRSAGRWPGVERPEAGLKAERPGASQDTDLSSHFILVHPFMAIQHWPSSPVS